MSTNLTVTLTTVDGKKVIHIDDHHGGNHRGTNPKPQSFVWKLSGNLAHGSFQSLDATPPGFAWITVPAKGIFGKPVISDSGRKLQLPDNHTSRSTDGEWEYQIAVALDGVVYVSERTGLDGTIRDPVIINR